MRRTTIAALVAGLALAGSPAVAEAAPSGTGAAGTGVAERADRGWTTVHKRAGAKIQVCRIDQNGNFGLEVRLDARKARTWVRGRSRIQNFRNGTWNFAGGHSSPWRRRGVEFVDSVFMGSPDPLRVQAKIRTRASEGAYTGWIDPSGARRCPAP